MKKSVRNANVIEWPDEDQLIWKRILQTDSIEELAHFWDTHDLADFDTELEVVDEPVFDLLTADRATTVTTRKTSV